MFGTIKHYRLTLLGMLFATVIGLGYTIHSLETQNGILDLYSRDDPLHAEYLKYIDHFGTTEDLVVAVEGNDTTTLHRMIDILAQRLTERSDLIDSVYYRFDREGVERHGLYFLSSEELNTLFDKLTVEDNPLHTLLFGDKPHLFFQSLAAKIAEGDASPQSARAELEKLLSLMQNLEHAATGQAIAPKAWQDFFKSDVEPRADIFDDSGYIRVRPEHSRRAGPALYLLVVHPLDPKSDTEKTEQLVKTVRADIAALIPQFPELRAGVTGAPALNADQFAISRTDMTIASIVDFIFVALLFVIVFREGVRPLFAALTLLAGISWSFAWTTLTVGHLNLFTLPFAIMLVGMGMDYSIHIISRYEEELLHGLEPFAALQKTLRTAGKSVAWGALTTAIAFWTTLLVDLKGFAELGWIVGSGLLLCMLGAVTMLPALLYGRDHSRPAALTQSRAPSYESSGFKRWGQFVTRYPAAFAVAVLVLTGGASYCLIAFPFGFDYNLLNLQAKGSEAVYYEHKLVESHLSPRTAIWMPERSLARDEIEQKIDAFKQLSTVDRVESLYSLLPEDQDNKQILIRKIATLYPAPRAIFLSSEHEWQRALADLKVAFHSIESRAFKAGRSDLLAEIRQLEESVTRIETVFLSKDSAPRLARFAEGFITPLRRFFATAVHADPIALGDYPPVIRDRFIAADGTQAVYIVPNVSVWERPQLARFIRDVRSVEPNVTGNPVQMYETLERVRTSYSQSALYAFVAIFLISWLDFKHWKSALLCTATIGTGILWLLGIMSATGLQFNMANLIAVPLVLGIGIDNIMHLLHRYRENPDWSEIFHHTGKAVGITTLTNISAFAGIAFSRHQGLASMGKIVLAGVSLCFLASLAVLPVLLKYLNRSRRQ